MIDDANTYICKTYFEPLTPCQLLREQFFVSLMYPVQIILYNYAMQCKHGFTKISKRIRQIGIYSKQRK